MLEHVLRGKRLRLVIMLTAALVACSSVAALAFSGPVTVHDDFFKPKTLTVSRGTKVSWSWVGYKDHNVTVIGGPAKFASKTMVRGTFSHLFTKAGTYHLECTIHPGMKMTVIVK